MSNNHVQTILQKIQTENIKPRAKWYFVIRHAALWVPGIFVTSVGAIAFAGVLYAVAHSGWEVREFIYPSRIDFLLATMPAVWIGSYLVFGVLIIKALRSTHSGYRLTAKTILGGSVLVSVVIGTVIFLLDKTFEADSIIRYSIHERELRVWSSPIEGRLSGTVESTMSDTLVLRDKDNVIWSVDMRGFGTTSFPFVELGQGVRVIGTSSDEAGSFIGCAIFPWDIGSFDRPAPVMDSRIPPPMPPVRQNNTSPDCELLLARIKERIHGPRSISMPSPTR
jgi:hypothetical protein